jgi:alanine racemase
MLRSMPRPISAIVDVAALRHNLAIARRAAGSRFLWAVIKANGYGHGIERAMRGFAAADGLALLDLAEAVRVREAGWSKPILLLEGFFEPSDLPLVERLELTSVLHCEEQLRLLELHRASRSLSLYVKFNTGMQRLGFAPDEATDLIERLQRLPQARIDALMMHFANADRRDSSAGPVSIQSQLLQFAQATTGWHGKRCLANSAALLLHPSIQGEAVRPGIALYGGTPETGVPAARFQLRAAMSLQSQVLAVQQVKVGAAVGYGSRWRAERSSRIGIVACGYADGYPRLAPDGTPLAVAGARVPLVGRVSMDMISVDLTDAPQAHVGAPVELWGSQVPVDEVAESAGTVGYELMCGLAPRVPVTEIDSHPAAAVSGQAPG